MTRKTAPPQEPIGFVTGGVIGGFAAGPVGAVIGAGLGTWLGRVEVAQAAKDAMPGEGNAAKVLDGLQGEVLFRTGSAELAPRVAHEIELLAEAVAKSPGLRVRVDGYADPRGSVDANFEALRRARRCSARSVPCGGRRG